MFTGLVEDVGVITDITHDINDKNVYSKFRITTRLKGFSLGDSISINGACHTIVSHSHNWSRIYKQYSWFEVESFQTTLEKTNLSQLEIGSKVNLETPLRADSVLGGHMVLGHVENTTHISNIKKEDKNTYFYFSIPDTLHPYIIEEGSVTIDGISLTIAKLFSNEFMCNIIQHTLLHTTLCEKSKNDIVNIEVDMYCKYIYKIIHQISSRESIS